MTDVIDGCSATCKMEAFRVILEGQQLVEYRKSSVFLNICVAD